MIFRLPASLLLLSLLFSIGLSGCMVQTVKLRGNAEEEPSGTFMHPFFDGGFGDEQEVDAAKVCGGASKVAKIQTLSAPLDVLVGRLTQGVATPRTAAVYCVKNKKKKT